MEKRLQKIRYMLEIDKEAPLTRIGENTVFLLSVIDAYKIAVKYFTDRDGQPALDIVDNLLKELEG